MINASEFNFRKIGVNMGALIMMKVPNIDLLDVVYTDFAMEKIGHALIKYVLSTNTRQKGKPSDKALDELESHVTKVVEDVYSKLKGI